MSSSDDDDSYVNPDAEMDRLVEMIALGATPDLDNYLTDSQDYRQLFERLKKLKANSNCMLYAAACCLEHSPDRHKYQNRAIELGNVCALYCRGFEKAQNGHRTAGALDGLRALEAGYVVKEPESIVSTSDFCRLILEQEVIQLRERVRGLEQQVVALRQELVEERLRPPELGGTDYEKAKLDFSTLTPAVTVSDITEAIDK